MTYMQGLIETIPQRCQIIKAIGEEATARTSVDLIFKAIVPLCIKTRFLIKKLDIFIYNNFTERPTRTCFLVS